MADPHGGSLSSDFLLPPETVDNVGGNGCDKSNEYKCLESEETHHHTSLRQGNTITDTLLFLGTCWFFIVIFLH